ncbi:MAG: serine/threonine-protein kinase [Candidatus Solibacter sp.]
MTPDRWEQIKQILGDALELNRKERAAFLERACGDDADLRKNVETLLSGDELGTFLNLDREPERLGPWRIVREVGRGGMGIVYLAERDDGQFEQRAAVKVIKRGMDTDAVLQRFYAERQILARLQHPNITRLLDGGMFDNRPYFVMEYLEGEALNAWCARTGAPLEQRIAMFLTVCDAVEYAHRNLVLHRDLKAGNILVDSTGTPKLLDFGIAKLLEQGGSTEQTALAARALTPQAASPEQVRGETLTTASDVYALGVLLFELLSGHPPYVAPSHPPDLARVVCETVPPKPSSVAEGAAAKTLQGDLDNIILKALEKDPARRYQHAADLAGDLRRYLQGLPVEARAGGAGYRVRKFATRHKRALAVAVIVFAAMTAAVTDAVLQGRRAQRRFNDLRQLAGTFLFEFHDAIATLPGATPARELVLQRAVQYLDSLSREAAGDTDLKLEAAEGYLRVGTVQGVTFESNLGKIPEARASFQKAIALFEPVVKERPNDLKAATGLGRATLGLTTTYPANERGLAATRGVESLLENLAKRRQLDSDAGVVLGQAYFGTAERLMDGKHNDEALAARMKSIAYFRDLSAKYPENADARRFLAQSEKRLAYFYITALRDFPKAAEHLTTSLAIDKQRLAREPNNTVVKLDLALDFAYLGGLMQRRGDLERALPFLQNAASARTEVLSADPRNFRVRYLLITDLTHLGTVYRNLNQSSESKQSFVRASQLVRDGDPASMSSVEAKTVIAELEKETNIPAAALRGISQQKR